MTSAKKRMQKREAKSPVVIQKEEMPVIAWDEMSIVDTLELSQRHDESTYMNVIAAKIQAGRATDADWEKLEYLRSPEYQVEVIERQAEDMAKYVASVPHSWFKKTAPETLDFDSPDTYKLLQPKRFIALYQMLMMNDAQALAISGN